MSETMFSWTWWIRPRVVAIAGWTFVCGVEGDPLGDGNGELVVYQYAEQDADTPTRHVVDTIDLDDHNNGALVIEPGQPVVCIYSNHSDSVHRVKISGVPVEQGVDFSQSAEIQISMPSTTYSVAVTHGADIYVICRSFDVNDALQWSWVFCKSSDWGETWTLPVALFASATNFYVTATRYGADVLRIVVGGAPGNALDPNQGIFYCEANMASGKVTKSDGTLLGRLGGTSLPIEIHTLEQVAGPFTDHEVWPWDVSDALEPEVAWGSFAGPPALGVSQSTPGTYHYSRLVEGVWHTYDLCQAARSFATSLLAVSLNETSYMGGAQLPANSPGGVVYVAREEGSWVVERMTTPDKGLNWAVSELVRGEDLGADFSTTTEQDDIPGSADRYVRCWPVDNRDGTPSWEVFSEHITRWQSFRNHDSQIVPVGLVVDGWLPLVAEEWDGSEWLSLGTEKFEDDWLDGVIERYCTAADPFGAIGFLGTTLDDRGYVSATSAAKGRALVTSGSKYGIETESA